ncbi:hypothetical protein [Paralcaligenes ureilyticus]|uniref:4-amino-4-deoxy-L-arabinose transferase-like glycosyltransferase n=1 Tax=Paralcaligenes ureilyticus TaxID=627131 RepID=A0A4R3M6M5_9BURK|nr:hypothetical protein [Paralcaligenes ureilyticus]TCT09064.1 hypothetical protein EDC26_104224 [Paralcaligenes ureilyticus]
MRIVKNTDIDISESKGSERLLLIFCAVSTTFILGWLLKYSRYGFDFTDEGYYLVWISNPFMYGWSTTQFGFLYHPLYWLLNGNIAALRQVNILITFCLAWFLVYVLFKKLAPSGSSKAQRLILSAGFATASLVFVVPWLPTPSYNSLALQALLVVGTGLLLAESTATRSSVVGWIVIGVGGWLGFMAKPSTAAALGVCVGLYALLAGKLNARLAFLSLVSAFLLLVLSAFIIDGSIAGFIARLKMGAELAALSGAGYSFDQIMRVDDFQLTSSERPFLIFMAVFSFFAAYFLGMARQSIRIVGFALSSVLFIAVIVFVLGVKPTSLHFGQFSGLTFWAVPFSALALALLSSRQKLFSDVPVSHWVLALAFLVFPYVYVFGSNGNYWQWASPAAIFWVLLGLIVIASLVPNKITFAMLVPLVGATQVIVTLLLQAGFNAPYRQPQALRLNSHLIDVGMPDSFLMFSEGYANYINDAIESAKLGGFVSGTPVIDFTGQSPGLLYALRAINVGYPWIAGGYPGSANVAKRVLRHLPCAKVVDAWLLLEPNGPRAISTDLLDDFGVSVPTHYKVVATWKTAKGAGGYPEQRIQQLAKPIGPREVALQACDAVRGHGR